MQHKSHLKVGDLIGFSGTGLVPWGINLATYGTPWNGLSHIGIVSELHGKKILYESTSMGRGPSVRHGRVVRGVQCHWMHDVCEWGDCKLWHIPLRRKLYNHEDERFRRFLDECIGRSYDFIGAGRAGGIVFRTLAAIFHPENLASMFCSELCAAALVNTGVWSTRSASKWSPNSLYRRLYWDGIVERRRRLKCTPANIR